VFAAEERIQRVFSRPECSNLWNLPQFL